MTFRGSIPAVITPFDNNLEIDYDALGNHIDFLIENGSHGLVSCGTTGESPTLIMMSICQSLNSSSNKLKNEFLLWRDVDLIQQKSQ